MSTRGSRIVFLVCVTVLCASSPAAFAQDATVLGGTGTAATENPLVVSEAQPLLGGQSLSEAEEVRLDSPEAVAAKEASQTKYEDLDGEEATKLIGEAFPDIVNNVAGGPPPLTAGQSLIGFASANAAELKTAGSGWAVVESSVPVATQATSGGWRPVDLSVSEAGSGFTVANPLVEVGIPRNLASGVVLRDSGVSLAPESEAGTAPNAVFGKVTGAVVLYPSLAVGNDVDALVKPTSDGFAEDLILRSELSPEVFYFRLGLPAGASLVSSGTGGVEVVDQGSVIATVLAPQAVDAVGRLVPVSMSLSGDVLKLVIPHAVDQYTYPIELDPKVVDSQLKESWAPRLTSNWHADTYNGTHSPFYPREEAGVVLDASVGHVGVFRGEWGAFAYETQGKSHIYEMLSETSASTKNAPIIENKLTIHRGLTTEKEESLGFNYSTTIPPRETCVFAGCATGTVTEANEHNTAEFEQWATEQNLTEFSSVFTSAAVEILQEEGPSESFDTTDEKFANGAQNMFFGFGEGWANKEDVEHGAAEIAVNATDPGIGISEYSFSSPNDTELVTWDKHSYLNTAEGECYGVQCPESRSSIMSPLKGLPDGNDMIEATVKNATGASVTVKKTLKVDQTPPHNISFTGLPSGNEIGERQYKARVEATDGEIGSGVPSSGIASLVVEVDGKPLGHTAEWSNHCSSGPCVASGEWSLNGAEFGSGEHEVTVVATDYAGNVGTQTFTLKVHDGASPVALGPGRVNPESGNYTLQAEDVSIPSGSGGGLTVGRSYNSRHLTGGSQSPFGPQWSLSTGGTETLMKQPNGSMVLAGADGGLTTFVSNKKGGFTAPSGDANLTLAEAEKEKVKEYVLSNAASGALTRFRLPAEGNGEAWIPAIQEGPVATDTVTYAFRAVKVAGKEITEPTEILAAVPSGVSCSPTLTRGCRALTFNYAEKTTAKSEESSGWGDYEGRLTRIYLTAWDPTKNEMVTKTVAQYAYDLKGRLRAEWNPEVSPELKTVYGYDSQEHVTALTPPGQKTWAFVYGTSGSDPNTGRLMSVARPAASGELWSGAAPAVKAGAEPSLSTANPIVGKELTISHGEWSGIPVAYGYQWEDCNLAGEECTLILGAVDEHYTPLYKDEGKRLEVIVTATNGGGSTTFTAATAGLAPPAYVTQWGKEGTATGQFKAPTYIAYAIGDLFVSDTGNNRIQAFGKEGKYLESYGSLGTEVGKFKEPEGIAGKPQGTLALYVADSGNKRIEMIASEGELKGTFHAASTTSAPAGVAVSPPAEEGVWNIQRAFVTGAKANGVGIFCGEALYPNERMLGVSSCAGSFGTEGTGNMQFKGPTGIAYLSEGPEYNEEGTLYVVDSGSNRVQQLHWAGRKLLATYETQFGSKGKGNGQLEGPLGIALTEPTYETHDAWVADSSNNRIEEFGPKGEYLSQIGTLGSGEGQFNHPTGIAAGEEGTLYVVDTNNNRVEEFQEKPTATGPTVSPPPAPTTGTGSVWTVDYGVPVSGTGAPNALGSSEVSAWAQKDDPIEGTAIFPPSKPMGWPAKEYAAATIYYLDTAGRTVNVANPNGGIATSEYSNGVPSRSLSADNRAAALAEGSKSKEASETLDTQSTYNSEGTELQSTLGPQRTVKLANGSETKARAHTFYYYDEGAPSEGGPYRLVTKVVTKAKLASGEETEERITNTSYSGQEGLGWKLREPTSVTTDPNGLKLTTTTLYEAATGEVTETRMPASKGAAGSPHDSQTIYYSAGANSSYPTCGNHPEWSGLVCRTQPAAQPTGTLPELPVTTTTYNLWDEPEKAVSTSGTGNRTTTSTFDAAGRQTSVETTSNLGVSLTKVSNEYSTSTGALIKQSRTMEGKTLSVARVENKLGQTESYTDANGNTSTYEFDSSGRITHTNDGKGTQTYTYSKTTGLLSELVDSAAGTFTAGYDAEGNLTSEHYPNGMTATTTINPAGEAVGLEYTKTSFCGTSCTWFADSIVPTAQGQWATQTSTIANDNYSYDAAARLTQVQETPTGEGCTTRIYGLDEDTNRTSLTTRAPGSEGKCATTGGTIENHTYDEADRLTDAHTSYNQFGDINSLGATDAGGQELTALFYADGQTKSITQNGETLTYKLDPTGRTREIEATGTTNTTTINHYAGPGDAPAWSEEPASGNTTRYIPGIGGLSAIQKNSETPVLELTDLQGNIIATAAKSETETKLLHIERTTEYGVPPTISKPEHYSWQGASQQPTELPTGLIAMGARTYIPQVGRFLQPDPQPGGSANAYTYTYGNPINESDPTGELTWGFSSENLEYEAQASQELIQREAAREAAALAEANAKAAAAAAPSGSEGAPVPLGGSPGWLCEAAVGTGQVIAGCPSQGALGASGVTGATAAGVHSWSIRMPSPLAAGLAFGLLAASSPAAAPFLGMPGWLVKALEAGTKVEMHKFAMKLMNVATIPGVVIVEISVIGSFTRGFVYSIDGYLAP